MVLLEVSQGTQCHCHGPLGSPCDRHCSPFEASRVSIVEGVLCNQVTRFARPGEQSGALLQPIQSWGPHFAGMIYIKQGACLHVFQPRIAWVS